MVIAKTKKLSRSTFVILSPTQSDPVYVSDQSSVEHAQNYFVAPTNAKPVCYGLARTAPPPQPTIMGISDQV